MSETTTTPSHEEAIEAVRKASSTYARFMAAASDMIASRPEHERANLAEKLGDTQCELTTDIDNAVMEALRLGVRFTETDLSHAGRAVAPDGGEAAEGVHQPDDELAAMLEEMTGDAIELAGKGHVLHLLIQGTEDEERDDSENYQELMEVSSKMADIASELGSGATFRREVVKRVQVLRRCGYDVED
ncbi:MAG: hypothetical protein WD294_14905 [Phycisphaeraceae bacterium]